MGESAGSGSTYKGIGSKGFSSGGGKYDSYDNKNNWKANTGSSGNYGNDYDSGYGGNSSNLNKYKKDLGGESAYKKGVEAKKQDEKKKEQREEFKQEPEEDSKNKPKPFDQQGRNLVKPSQVSNNLNKTVDTSKNTAQKGYNTATNSQARQTQQSTGFDFFGEEPTPAPPTNIAPPNPVVSNASGTQSNSPFGAFQFPQQNTQPNIQQNPNALQGINLFAGQGNVQVQSQQGLGFNQQNLNQQGFNLNLGQGFTQPQPQKPVNVSPQPSQGFGGLGGLGGLGGITMNPKPTGASNQMFTMNPMGAVK